MDTILNIKRQHENVNSKDNWPEKIRPTKGHLVFVFRAFECFSRYLLSNQIRKMTLKMQKSQLIRHLVLFNTPN